MRPALFRQILRARSRAAVTPLRRPRRFVSGARLADIDIPPQPFPLYSPTEDEFYNRAPQDEGGRKAAKSTKLSPEEQSEQSKAESSLQAQRRLKKEMTAKVVEMAPELSEADLRLFYQDLVRSGQDEIRIQDEKLALEAPEEQEQELSSIGAQKRRQLLPPPAAARQRAVVLARLTERLGVLNQDSTTTELSTTNLQDERQRLISHIVDLTPASLKNCISSGTDDVTVPLGLLTGREWAALIDESIAKSDIASAVSVLQLMRAHGQQADIPRIRSLLSIPARSAPVESLVTMAKALLPDLDLTTHHHLLSTLLVRDPQTVIDYLTVFEREGKPLPQTIYQSALEGMLQKSRYFRPTSRSSALAFDLFSHMRVIAHPQPSRDIYRTMIAGCAASWNPQPERARDLWTEMTMEGREYRPTRADYDAYIMALSSTKGTYLDAFEAYRAMIAQHEDATLVPFEDKSTDRHSPFMPSLSTWKALLQGAKRAGDLDRGRWLLGQMMRSLELAETDQDLSTVMPDAESITNVLHTYAAWKAPKVPRMVTSPSASANAQSFDMESVKNAQIASPAEARPVDMHFGPRTSSEALSEAKAIFDRALAETLSRRIPSDLPSGPFSMVRMSALLVNAYMSVVLRHSPSLQTARETWEATWSEVVDTCNVRPNGWSYIQVLEKCASGIRGGIRPADRSASVEWARTIWSRYRLWVDQTETQLSSSSKAITVDTQPDPKALSRMKTMRVNLGLHPRETERAWVAIIRLHAKNTLIDSAVDLLRQFHSLYPPEDIGRQYTPWAPSKTFIQVSDPTLIAESDVPPHVLFNDMDVLHQELSTAGRTEDLRWLTWVVKEYEGELKKMRKRRMNETRARPPSILSTLNAAELDTDDTHLLEETRKERVPWARIESNAGPRSPAAM